MLHYQEILSNRITLLGNSYYAIQDGPIADYCSVGVQHHLPRLGIHSTDILDQVFRIVLLCGYMYIK